MPTNDEIIKLKKKAIEDAKAYWKNNSPAMQYECNQCGYQVQWNAEGSSYYLDWLRCKSCTDKIFPVKMGAVNVNYLGREIDIPLDELVMAGQEFSDTFLLNAVADWLAEPKVLKLHVKRKKMGK